MGGAGKIPPHTADAKKSGCPVLVSESEKDPSWLCDGVLSGDHADCMARSSSSVPQVDMLSIDSQLAWPTAPLAEII